jgi:hypothetical protein
MRAVFSGKTVSLHDIGDHRAFSDAIERIRDEVALQRMISGGRAGAETFLGCFASSAKMAISILDLTQA